MTRRISPKDIQGFGRVLEAVGQLLQERPDLLMSLLAHPTSTPKNQEAEDPISSAKVKAFSLFDFARSNDEETLITRLREFSQDELRMLLKRYHLGGSKLSSKDAIVRHIAEQSLKRTVDVFRDKEPGVPTGE